MTAPDLFQRHYESLCRGADLRREESRDLFALLLQGELSAPGVAGLLTALKIKGESPEEIAGAAEALREAATPFDTRGLPMTLDTCGTGGDGASTLNISTAVAIVCAELGLSVVKHGNRSVSSRCGSADVLEQLGVVVDAGPEAARRCLDASGICFLFAPRYHAGVRHAMPVRRALRTRTIFNLLGPIINPARPTHQLMGVYDPALCRPVAETLRALGTEAAFVVHGAGLDEIAAHGSTTVATLRDGTIEEFVLTPGDFGVAPVSLDALRGGAPEENAAMLRALLSGRGTVAQNTAVAINAAAALVVCGREDELKHATERALDVLTTGAAARRLDLFVEASRGA